MPLSEREELELLELEEKEKGAQPSEPQPLAQEVSPVEAEEPNKDPLTLGFWADAVKNEFTKPLDPSASAALSNPLMGAFSPAAGAAAGAAVSGLGRGAVNAAEKFATSPLPGKISDATNMVGAAKGLFSKAIGAAGESLPPVAKKAADLFSGGIGRSAAYSNPFTAAPQAISDSARVVKGAQGIVAKMLDSSPEKLGKFATVLKSAAEKGPSALATTEFILSKTDPAYQKLMKEAREQQ